jgi:alpha-ribazole phosphatase
VDLILIRHPAPAVGVGICYGKTDVPLAGDAAEAARSIAERLAALGAPSPQHLVTSPLQRCTSLAEELARHFDCVCRIDARLQEIDFGEWEGQAWDAIDRAALDAWAADLRHARMHGGESVEQFESRIGAWLEGWTASIAASAVTVQAPRVLAVTHAGVMRMIAALTLGAPLETTLKWPLEMPAVVWLRRAPSNGAWRLLHWNV